MLQYNLHPFGHRINCDQIAKKDHCNPTHLLLIVWWDYISEDYCSATHPLFVMDVMWLYYFHKVLQPCSRTIAHGIWCK